MDGADLLREAERQLTVCNACRYCEAYCAVFPALELRTGLRDGDITYLANLCHDCRNCYDACMFAPPHEFAINIPQALAAVRVTTYERYSWPGLFARLFRNGWGTAAAVLAGVGLVLLAIVATGGTGRLVSSHVGPGAFYEVVPYLGLLLPALAVSLYGLLVIIAGAWEFSKDTQGSPWDLLNLRALARATSEAITLHWQKGGGVGCYYPKRRGSHARRFLHALVFWGFGSAFVSTTLAAIYQDWLGLLPPYPVVSLPVLFGIAGGVMMIAGTSGLILLKVRSDPVPAAVEMTAMDYAFLVVLDLAAITGMLTLIFRGTRAMGLLLTVHLGVLAGLYVTAPYGKFVHFVYRYVALVKRCLEQDREEASA
jgi:citrate/tricarballylate utilization protein